MHSREQRQLSIVDSLMFGFLDAGSIPATSTIFIRVGKLLWVCFLARFVWKEAWINNPLQIPAPKNIGTKFIWRMKCH